MKFKHGAKIIERPKHLATDDSKIIDTLRDISSKLEEEGINENIILLLEPTSPLRNKEDILKCINFLGIREFKVLQLFQNH